MAPPCVRIIQHLHSVHLRPPLNDKLFPVLSEWTKNVRLELFLSYFQKKKKKLSFPPVHSSLHKHEIRKKKEKIPDRPTGRFFTHQVDKKLLFT